MSEFQVGDLVHLKSGGPLMSVFLIAEGGRVHCIWQTTDNKVGEVLLPPELLVKPDQEAVSKAIKAVMLGDGPQPQIQDLLHDMTAELRVIRSLIQAQFTRSQ